MKNASIRAAGAVSAASPSCGSAATVAASVRKCFKGRVSKDKKMESNSVDSFVTRDLFMDSQFSPEAFKKEIFEHLQKTLEALDVDVHVYQMVNDPEVKELGKALAKIVAQTNEQPTNRPLQRKFFNAEEEITKKIEEKGLQKEVHELTDRYLKSVLYSTGGPLSIHLRISETKNDDVAMALSRIYRFLGFAHFGNTHVVLRLGQHSYEWTSLAQVIWQKLEIGEDRPGLSIPIWVQPFEQDAIEALQTIVLDRSNYSGSEDTKKTLQSIADAHYDHHFRTWEPRFQALCELIWLWQSEREYDQLDFNCQNFLLSCLDALKLHLPQSEKLEQHILTMANDLTKQRPDFFGANAYQVWLNSDLNFQELCADAHFSICSVRYDLSDMRKRLHVASNPVVSKPLDIQGLGLPEGQEDQNGFKSLFKGLLEVHGRLVGSFKSPPESLGRDIRDAFKKLDLLPVPNNWKSNKKDPPTFAETVINHLVFQAPPQGNETLGPIDLLKTQDGETVATLTIRNGFCSTWVLYSHGNAEDLGDIEPWMNIISQTLRVNVIAYDYKGYGQSTPGVASESSVFQYIVKVKEHLNSLRVLDKDIILWGRSLGTGPTCFLASKGPVGAVVLESGFSSLLHAAGLLGSICQRWLKQHDMFVNKRWVLRITSPILFLHGTEDEVIPFSSSEEMAKVAHNGRLCLIKGAGHNDLQSEHHIDVMMHHIKQFITEKIAGYR